MSLARNSNSSSSSNLEQSQSLFICWVMLICLQFELIANEQEKRERKRQQKSRIKSIFELAALDVLFD